ncbi:MAG: hypothetical protein ACREAK_08825 [Nitrosarchaeum sp.]
MTLKLLQNKKTAIVISLIAVLAFGSQVSGWAQYAEATLCSSAQGNHCYATGKRTVTNDGNKVTMKASDMTVVNCNTDWALSPQWVRFPNNDWAEVGIGTGNLNGLCITNEKIYTYHHVGADLGWNIYSTATPGTSYTFSIDDGLTNTYWQIKQGSTLMEIVPSTQASGSGEVGTEITKGTATIPVVHMSGIQYLNTFWSTWTSSVSLSKSSQTDNPLNYLSCTNYYHLHFGSGTLSPCT